MVEIETNTCALLWSFLVLWTVCGRQFKDMVLAREEVHISGRETNREE